LTPKYIYQVQPLQLPRFISNIYYYNNSYPQLFYRCRDYFQSEFTFLPAHYSGNK